MAEQEKEGQYRPLSTAFDWLRRMFFGGSKNLDAEKLESPTVAAARAFFRRKLAVLALVVLVGLFLLVFIGPLLLPINLSYTDPLQANIAPNYSFLRVNRALADNVRDINGFANFTVGVSRDNDLYIWGHTYNAISKLDYAEFPEEIQDGNVAYAAAGSDHIVAITTDGRFVCWGDNSTGQYGYLKDENSPYVQMPEELITGTVDVAQVDQLTCGYQITALILDGRLYMWGNANNMADLRQIAEDEAFSSGVKKVALSNFNALVLMADGTVTGGQSLSFYKQSAYTAKDGRIDNLQSYLRDRTVIDIAATNQCYAIVTDDGNVIVFGAIAYGEDQIPQIPAGEKIVSVSGGTRHFVALSDRGNVYAWGHNDGNQTNVHGKTASHIFTGAKQTYLVDSQGELTAKVGFRGYLMGTDSLGRDVFVRIVHGGRMTMTVGAVAVIISTLIAVIIGCLSGYFGGWVDTLLMRITEVFSAIPFLPFAMLLSYVIRTMPIGETARIGIVMVILGLLSWPALARMIRAQVLAEREKEFVVAARSMGIRDGQIAFRHILPNVLSVVLVSVTLDFAGCLLTESSLSYLGFGVQQPQPTWGNMLYGSNNSVVIQNYWWQWVFPAIFLALATVCINLIGDNMRDVLDPKSSREQ